LPEWKFQVNASLKGVFVVKRPALVLPQGDTASTLAAALNSHALQGGISVSGR
jgi:hypothetical protein